MICPGCHGDGITVDPDERMALPNTCGRCGGSGHLCPKCQAPMRPGQALQQTHTGIPDFIEDPTVVTVSPGGPGKLVDCLKCTKCGHSVSI